MYELEGPSFDISCGVWRCMSLPDQTDQPPRVSRLFANLPRLVIARRAILPSSINTCILNKVQAPHPHIGIQAPFAEALGLSLQRFQRGPHKAVLHYTSYCTPAWAF
jgi:hypothetical protein